MWIKNGAGLVPLHRIDSVITQVDDGHPVGLALIGEARFAYDTKGQQS